ncbi:hypothetical protein OHC33_002715 [Knufia fluminis]|uniref:Uncharacterized protein n=1 Tax=Knufia fluminis TaxID=191047 RepID=A0AAN8EQ81_9EURO|nr:hypothetical protein OHC33_002715 [Knufia fluminis]
MSYYDDRRPATRDRRRGNDDYYDDTVYTNTRDNQRSTAVVKRRSDSPEYDEEIRRDFSPGGGGYYRETTVRKSGTRPVGRARSAYDEERRFEDDRSFASSRRGSYYGARRAGYDDRPRGGRSRRDDYSDYSSRSRSRSRTPPKRERRKSMPEEALAALGLGGLVAKITGKSRSRSRSSSRSRGGRARSRSGRDSSEHRKEQLQQAFKAAVLAGAGAAFRARNEDGGWNGEKGKRVLTAALTAGGVDGFINRDKDPEKHKFRDTIGAAVAGIATDRLVNGRSQSRGPDGRRHSPDRGSRSRSRSKAGDLLAGGAIAAAAKKAMDSVRGRSQSRGRDRDRSPSYDSRDDSRSPPRGARSRSRSVIARGLSKVGLNKQADKIDPYGARERSASRGPRNRSRSRGRYADDDSYIDDRRSPYDPPNYGRGSMYDNREVSKNPNPSSSRSHSRAGSRALDSKTGALINRPNSVGPGGGVLSPPPPGYEYDKAPRHNGDPETDSDSDLGSSSEDEALKKKSRKRLAVSGGLATVATIHAGHSVYQSMEKREARKRALRDGTIDKEEASKHKSRDRLQDAASIGLAALGLKGAYSEWQEMKNQNDEWREELEKRKRHARKREARRQKLSMVGMSHGEAGSSAPTFGEPSPMSYGGGGGYGYDGNGPYMSGANGGPGQGPMMNGMNNNTQYFDDNPYGWMGHQGNAEEQQQGGGGGYNGAGGGGQYYGNGNYNGAGMNFPPPPAHGGTGFPPPPGGQPPPPQART